MYQKVFWLVLLVLSHTELKVQAQAVPVNPDTSNYVAFDSLSTIVQIDTITPKLLMPLNSLTKAQILNSLNTGFGYEKTNFTSLTEKFLQQSFSTSKFQRGKELAKGNQWVLIALTVLLILFAVLKQVFSKQLYAIVQSFFSNRALVNLNKEDHLFTSWPFFLLFIQFGFTIGLFCYLASVKQELRFAGSGFQFFVTISAGVIILFVLKVLLLKLIGFIFDIQRPVNEYVSILYLSYFNAALLFIPLVVAFALSPLRYGDVFIAIAVVLLVIIFIFQFLRAGVNILSHYRFSKVYLFLYFCTLEICPILILIKAIGF